MQTCRFVFLKTKSCCLSVHLLFLVNEKEIIELEKRYWYLKSTSSTGKFDLNLFKNCTTPPLPERFTKSM